MSLILKLQGNLICETRTSNKTSFYQYNGKGKLKLTQGNVTKVYK